MLLNQNYNTESSCPPCLLPSLPTSSSTMWILNDCTVSCYLGLITEVFTVQKIVLSKECEQNWSVPAVAFKVRWICCRKIKVLQATKRRIAFQRGQVRDLLKQKTIARTMLHMSSRVSIFTRSCILPLVYKDFCKVSLPSLRFYIRSISVVPDNIHLAHNANRQLFRSTTACLHV